jgi:hypothetical protein
MDYIRNSKNRKLKTQILGFFSRINFGTYRLGLPGKSLMFCTLVLFSSLFFPWLSFKPTGWVETHYWAFSLYLWGIGYGIIGSIVVIAFFLLSHEKKEHLRWYVPFRLSDAQAIVFIAAMLMIATLHSIVTSFAYARIASQEVMSGLGLEIATSAIFLMLFVSYFFSQSEKTRAVTMGYLDKKEVSHLDEYADILDPKNKDSKEKSQEKNMTLPI